MPSMTFWTRLEPQARQAGIEEGLQARLYDPLWLLARQWQTGEFAGEDGGTPVSVRMRAERLPLTRYRPGLLPGSGQGSGQAYHPEHLPLETLVEREPPSQPERSGQDLRLAAEAGLHFLNLLETAGVTGLRPVYLGAYPLPPAGAAGDQAELDPESRRFLAVLARRAPDGLRMYADLKQALQPPGGGAPGLPPQPAVPDADRSRVIAAGLAFLALFEDLFGEGLPPAEVESAWNAERMEYQFALSAPAPQGEVVLTAQEYPGGRLDWDNFDLAPGASLGASQDSTQPETVTRTVIATPARYHGMPGGRWWEFEDAQVNFGRVQAAPDELLRLMLIEFALTYGNDWFVAPYECRPGAVYRLKSLVVTDAFGVRSLVPHYSQVDPPGSGWSMYALDQPPALPGQPAVDGRELLFLPPVLAASLHGPALEQVLLVRDEMANMAWAVERVVAGAAGQPVDRLETYHRLQSARQAEAGSEQPGSAADSGEAVYRLATPVPDYWLPLLPVRPDPQSAEIRLRRARVLLDQNDGPTTPTARGRILEPGQPLSLFEEEVPRSGVQISLVYQSVRWQDGSNHLWLGRQKRPGRGESSSGLRFDQLIEPNGGLHDHHEDETE